MSTKLARGDLRGAERVDLATFLSREATNISEHVHILFDRDERRLALYRSVGEPGEGEWIRTDIDGRVTFGRRKRVPKGFFLANGEADTFLTWLDRLRVERSADVTIKWWETNNSPIIEQAGLDSESLFCQYETDSGRQNEVQIHGVYKNDVQMMANF